MPVGIEPPRLDRTAGQHDGLDLVEIKPSLYESETSAAAAAAAAAAAPGQEKGPGVFLPRPLVGAMPVPHTLH